MARLWRYGGRWALVYLGLMTAAPAQAAGPLIWALGDSLTAGYGLPPADGFTNRLQAALRQAGVPATVRNGGITGDTSAQGRARLLWGLRGLGVKPDLVILELGANDMLRGMPPSQTAANLDAIMKKLVARKLPVFIAGMKANRGLGADYASAFDALYPALAKKYGATLYPFFLDGVALDPSLNQPDMVHPNEKGVAVIVARMLPALTAWLGKLG